MSTFLCTCAHYAKLLCLLPRLRTRWMLRYCTFSCSHAWWLGGGWGSEWIGFMIVLRDPAPVTCVVMKWSRFQHMEMSKNKKNVKKIRKCAGRTFWAQKTGVCLAKIWKSAAKRAGAVVSVMLWYALCWDAFVYTPCYLFLKLDVRNLQFQIWWCPETVDLRMFCRFGGHWVIRGLCTGLGLATV